MESFSWKHSFDVVFLVYKKCCSFFIRYQVSFFEPKQQQKNGDSAPLTTNQLFCNIAQVCL